MKQNFLEAEFSYTKKQAFKVLYRKGFFLSMSSSAKFQSVGTFLVGIYFVIDYILSKFQLPDPIIFAVICFALCFLILAANYSMMNKNAEEYARIQQRSVTMNENEVCLSAEEDFVCVEITAETEWKQKKELLYIFGEDGLVAAIPNSVLNEDTIEKLENAVKYKKRIKAMKKE